MVPLTYNAYNKNMPNTRKRSSKLHHNRNLLWALGVLVVIGAVFATLQLTNTTHFFNSHPDTVYAPSGPTGGQSTKGETGAPALTHPSVSPTSKTPSVSTNGSTGTGATLVAPTGDFVNNHRPSLSSKAESQMFSTCNTNPGASCQITFTNVNTGSVKTLSAQLVNSGGAVYWSWTLQEIGLTQGTWKTLATANYNGQAKSTADAMNLEVQP